MAFGGANPSLPTRKEVRRVELMVDLDGTLFAFGKLGKYKVFATIFNYLLSHLSFLYLLRRPNKKLVAFLEKWKDQGGKIILVSSTNKQHYSLVKTLLSKSGIPCDEIILKEKPTTPLEFKLDTLFQVSPAIIIDDDRRLLKKYSLLFGGKIRKFSFFGPWVWEKSAS